jgi:hypothetical protein
VEKSSEFPKGIQIRIIIWSSISLLYLYKDKYLIKLL